MIFITLGSKGGIAKTTFTAYLAEHALNNGEKIHCVDLDPENATFSRYKPLEVKHINIKDEKINAINPVIFDDLVNEIFENKDKEIFIDCGSTTYSAIVNYFFKHDFFDLLNEEELEYCIVGIVAGGGNAVDSIQGLGEVHGNFPNVNILLVENELLGSLDTVDEDSGKTIKFHDTKEYKKIVEDEKLLGTVCINQDDKYIVDDIVKMTSKRLTFEELKTSDFKFMERRRLIKHRDNIFSQLDSILYETEETT